MLQTIYTPDHYVGTGLLGTYAFSFRILRKADLLAQTKDTSDVVTDLTLDSDYTIAASSVNNAAGGEIVLTTLLASGTELFLSRQTSLTQLVHIEEGTPIATAVFEEVFDRLTMFAQELKYLARQALHFPTSSTYVDVTVADPEAGKLLQWNSTLDAVQNVLASSLSITHTIVDVSVAAGEFSAVITHNLADATARIIGFSSTYFTSFKVTSQDANTITVELTEEAPAGGGTLTVEVAI